MQNTIKHTLYSIFIIPLTRKVGLKHRQILENYNKGGETALSLSLLFFFLSPSLLGIRGTKKNSTWVACDSLFLIFVSQRKKNVKKKPLPTALTNHTTIIGQRVDGG